MNTSSITVAGWILILSPSLRCTCTWAWSCRGARVPPRTPQQSLDKPPSARTRTAPPAGSPSQPGTILSGSWRHGASFPGLLRESEAAGRGERGPGCRSGHGSSGDTRRGCVRDVRVLSGIFFFFKKTQFPRKKSRSLGSSRTNEVGSTGSRLHAPGSIYRSETAMLASWRATAHSSAPALAAQGGCQHTLWLSQEENREHQLRAVA